MLGFTAVGVEAASVAAAWQSSIGNVAAGSLFAWLQASAATGSLRSATVIAAAAVAASVGMLRSIYYRA